MRQPTNSIDGFVSRPGRRELGQSQRTTLVGAGESNRPSIGTSNRPIYSTPQAAPTPLPPPVASRRISRSDIDESLNTINDDVPQPKRKRRLFGRKVKPAVHPRRRWAKRVTILIILVLLGIGSYIGVKGILASSTIFKGNLFGILASKPLKMDASGRTNILVFGTSGSVDDQRHDGANLTDTLMVLSVDQNKKNAYMVSLPRDLYVKYGQACNAGYQGKINEMYLCYSNGTEDDEAGATALKGKVSDVTGLDIQYYAHINWAVVVGSVDAVGGVDVDVAGNGGCGLRGYPDGSVVDANMKIKYTPGVHHMDGLAALTFSRARGEMAPTCGLAQGDFDRQANQQKVLKALQQKALSAGTLTNVGKVTSLIDALGQNLRTNFDTSEIQTLMGLGKDIQSDKIGSINLVDQSDPQIVSGNIPGAGSTQTPKLGTYDYSGIHAYIQKKLNANDVSREDAHIAVFNGSGTSGYAAKRQMALGKLGFTVTAAQNAPEGTYDDIELFDLTGGKKPATKAKLESIYGVTSKIASDNPITVSSDTDFVIIYGKALATD